MSNHTFAPNLGDSQAKTKECYLKKSMGMQGDSIHPLY